MNSYNLSINLIAPDGTSINLVSNYGGDSDSFTNTCINGNSPISISTGWGPFTGTYRSSQPIGNLNNGQNPNGIWILDIVDGFGADQGILRDWNITFSNHPARPIIFNSSNLPLFLINTLGGNIVDNFKINAQLKIINNAVGVRNHVADPAQITSNIGIEIRGSSSAGFPQKGYGFSTWDISNNDTNISLLGFPEESDWILYNPYNDKSLLRNVLVYKLSNDMHQYATRTKFCEVYINGLYEGVYVFMEKRNQNDLLLKIASSNEYCKDNHFEKINDDECIIGRTFKNGCLDRFRLVHGRLLYDNSINGHSVDGGSASNGSGNSGFVREGRDSNNEDFLFRC